MSDMAVVSILSLVAVLSVSVVWGSLAMVNKMVKEKTPAKE